jgi:hypothetical protein
VIITGTGARNLPVILFPQAMNTANRIRHERVSSS